MFFYFHFCLECLRLFDILFRFLWKDRNFWGSPVGSREGSLMIQIKAKSLAIPLSDNGSHPRANDM